MCEQERIFGRQRTSTVQAVCAWCVCVCVGSFKLYVSLAKEPYKRDYILEQEERVCCGVSCKHLRPLECFCQNDVFVFQNETTATHFSNLMQIATQLTVSATHYNTLQHTATHCNTLQHTLQHTATLSTGTHTIWKETRHCNTLHRTATHPTPW